MIYDMIGDIHGQADKLEGLLLKLKYKMEYGIYRHNDRKVVFVGDFIDRGRQNRRVIGRCIWSLIISASFMVAGTRQ